MILNRLLLLIFFLTSILFYSNTPEKSCKKESIQQRKISKTNPTESIKIGENILLHCKNDSIKTLAYALIGHSYLMKGDYANAFENAYTAKEKLENNKFDINDIINNNLLLVGIYNELGLRERIEQELDQSLLFIQKNDKSNFFLIGRIYFSYGNLYMSLKKYDLAIKKHSIALEYFKKIKDPNLINSKERFIYEINSEIANDYLWLDDFKKAEYYLNAAEKSLTTTQLLAEEKYNTILRFALLYSQTNRYQEAIQTLELIYRKPNMDPNTQFDISMTMADAYEGLGNIKKYESFKNEADSIRVANFQRKSVGLQEVVKKVENQIAKTERRHLLFRIANITLISALLLIVFLAIRNYRHKIKKQKETYRQLILSLEEEKKVVNKIKGDVKNTDEITFTKSELQLLEKLKKFENSKTYLKKNMTLAVLAVKLDTNAFYLSDIVNKAKSKNFSTYISELRINYITKELYNNPTLLNYKISYLAELCGFNSHNTFTLAFKKVTNISPSLFIEQRKNEIKDSSNEAQKNKA